MKIRTQFLMLIAGIVIVPLVAVGALFLFEYSRAPERTLVPGYKEINAISGSDISREDWEELKKYLAVKPENIDFIVIDGAATVLYSTVADYPATSRLTDGELLSLLWDSNGRYLYQIDSPARTGNANLLVVTRVLRERHRPVNPVTRVFRAILAVFLALFLFSAAMSALIARSITRSVTILEANTKRIASGELDLELDAKGSNEITSLTSSLNVMRLSLKEEQARRSRFIMGVSHDLKTPLALIKGYSEAINDGIADDPDSMRKSLEIIGSKVNQLESMIEDLIGFVKLNTGEWRMHLDNHAIAPMLEGFARRIASDGELLGRSVSSAITIPESVIVPIDERLFLRALENITTNSFRYTRRGGSVRIDARMEGSEAVIRISDDGSGIAGEDLPHIFDLFYRGTNSRREEGMGLGLSVVKSVADAHGWTVSVDSSPGTSTTFAIRVPANQPAKTPVPAQEEPSSSSKARFRSSPPPKPTSEPSDPTTR